MLRRIMVFSLKRNDNSLMNDNAFLRQLELYKRDDKRSSRQIIRGMQTIVLSFRYSIKDPIMILVKRTRKRCSKKYIVLFESVQYFYSKNAGR